ncbi:hypothetical protein G6F31_013451 [Rhizopus arrhizus]|nr:hypothetical protein G6F31_013451 [Rhizopus arrhizus]
MGLVLARLVHDGSARLLGVLCRIALVGACVLPPQASFYARHPVSQSGQSLETETPRSSAAFSSCSAAAENSSQQLPYLRQRRHESLDLAVRLVGRQRGTAGGRDAEVLHRRARAVRAQSHLHPFRSSRGASCSCTCSPPIRGQTTAAFPRASPIMRRPTRRRSSPVKCASSSNSHASTFSWPGSCRSGDRAAGDRVGDQCAGPGQRAAVQPELVGARQQRELRAGRECQRWWLDGDAQRRCEQLWCQPWQGQLCVSGEGLQFRRVQPVFGSRDGGGGAAAGGDEPLPGGVADDTQAALSGPVLRRMESGGRRNGVSA